MIIWGPCNAQATLESDVPMIDQGANLSRGTDEVAEATYFTPSNLFAFTGIPSAVQRNTGN